MGEVASEALIEGLADWQAAGPGGACARMAVLVTQRRLPVWSRGGDLPATRQVLQPRADHGAQIARCRL
jgi:hypothetical protein